MKKQIIVTFVLVGMAGTAYASGGSGQAAPLLSLQMLAKTTNLIILLFLLHKFAKKPIANMLASALEKTKAVFDASRMSLQDSEKKLAEYKTKIANLEKELETKQQATLKNIEQEKLKILEDAQKQAQKIQEQAQYGIEQNLLKAKTEIRQFMIDESVRLAEETIKKQVGGKEQKALIKNYTKFLGNKAS